MSLFGFGQEDFTPLLHFDHLTIEDGLSHNRVRCLLQDNNGYLWIGTQNGLNKYDGFGFEEFKSKGLENSKDGFLGNNITALFEDSRNNLWVGTSREGINFKKNFGDEFIQLDTDTLSLLKDYDISMFYEDDASNLWIATRGTGIIKYNLDSKEQQLFNKSNSDLSNDLVFDIVQDAQGVIWVATAGVGINYLKDDKFLLLNPYLDGNPGMSGFRKSLELDKDELWLGTEGTGLYRINTVDKSVKRHPEGKPNSLSSNAIIDIHLTKNRKLFITTDGSGLNVLNLANMKMTYHNYQNNNHQALNSNSLDCLLEDGFGNIWIGTYNGGLNIYKPNKTWFEFVFPKKVFGDQLMNKSILSLGQNEKENEIYIGTDGGGLNIVYPASPNEITNFSTKNSQISGNVIKSIYQRNPDEYWLGVFAESTSIFNAKTQSFKEFPEAKSVWAIDGKSNGDIYLGTMGNGLVIYNSKINQTTSYRHDDEDSLSIASNLIMSVLCDKNNHTWIGTADGGLDYYDDQSKTFSHFQYDPIDSSSLSSNNVSVVFQDSKGDLWVGTENSGLNKWLENGKFEHISESDGLIANSIMGIAEDAFGDLWISTFVGISKYKSETKKFQNFDFRTSQNLNQFNQMSIMSSESSMLYFGGTNGLHSINPKTVKTPISNAPIKFTNLEVSNEEIKVSEKNKKHSILDLPIESASKVNLSYLDNSFSIAFSAIDFTNPNEKIYQYILEGFDKSWKITKPFQHNVSYTNIDPGNYTFKVKRGENESAIEIMITPPFWRTTWFKTLVSFLFIIIIVGGLYYLMRRQDAQHKRELLQLEKENLETSIEAKNSKLMFFAVQMAHKNEILSSIKDELKNNSDYRKSNSTKLINRLDRELKNENYWEDFNLYFNRVDQHFVTSIQREYPLLTTNDLRLCSLMRMNLSNKEIASLCNISTRAVEQSKYRLKKRLALNKEHDLSRFISIYESQS